VREIASIETKNDALRTVNRLCLNCLAAEIGANEKASRTRNEEGNRRAWLRTTIGLVGRRWAGAPHRRRGIDAEHDRALAEVALHVMCKHACRVEASRLTRVDVFGSFY
jgi:hypothetical protein